MSASQIMNTDAPAERPVLEVSHLIKDFTLRDGFWRKPRKLRAVNDVNLSLHKGKALAIVGESGSGKSTIARMICQMPEYELSGGQILLDGKDLSTLAGRAEWLAFRHRVQMIFQDPFGALNPVHTIGWLLDRAVKLHQGGSKEERWAKVLEALSLAGLEPPEAVARKYPFQLSGGQRQRACIARVLATGADVVMADEPTSMLDVSIRIGILNLLAEMKQNMNAAFLYITHDLASARYFADDIMVMYAGHMVEKGPADEVIDNPRHPYTRLLISAVPDPDREALAPLAGGDQSSEVPTWTPTSIGCPFASRCPHVTEQCRRENPPVVEVDSNQVRCHLAGQV